MSVIKFENLKIEYIYYKYLFKDNLKSVISYMKNVKCVSCENKIDKVVICFPQVSAKLNIHKIN